MWDSMCCNLKWVLFLPTALITLMRWESITLHVGRGITNGVKRQDEDYCSDQEMTITHILSCNIVNSDFLFYQLISITMYPKWFFSHYYTYLTETINGWNSSTDIKLLTCLPLTFSTVQSKLWKSTLANYSVKFFFKCCILSFFYI